MKGDKERAIELFTQALDLPVSDPGMLPIVQMIRFARVTIMSQLGKDPKLLASELNKYLVDVKDNEQAWELYLNSKLRSSDLTNATGTPLFTLYLLLIIK